MCVLETKSETVTVERLNTEHFFLDNQDFIHEVEFLTLRTY